MTATTHVETEQVQGRRLGRRAPKNAPHLKLASFLTGVVPEHPAAVDHLAGATYGLYGNDTYGDCGPTSVANQRRLVTAHLGAAEQDPSQNDVFDLYRRSGNPGFDPATGVGDNGVDMQTMLEAVQSGGIGGTQCLAFAKVDTSNPDEARAAISIFGSLLLGVNLETAQQTQTNNGLWDYQQSGEWGGHAILAGRYTSAAHGADVSVVTWAEIVATTDAFWTHQVEEAWVVVWPEHLGTVEFQQGVNLAQLGADFQALTGRPFPGGTPTPPVPPTPPVVPVVDPADEALVTALGPWLSEHHTGGNRRAVHAVQTWMAAKGLRAS